MTTASTFIVTSFERDKSLARLIASIRRYYPTEPIIVADYGKERPAPESLEYRLLRLPFDAGLSAGRNALVAAVETPYFILLDDDFEFTAATRVEKLVAIAERCGHDVVAGGVVEMGELRHYEGQLERNGTTLMYRAGALEDHGDHTTHEMVLNFFAGRTESIRRFPWEPELKCAEHTAWAWAAKGHLSFAYCSDVTVIHHRDRDPYYNTFRGRAKKLFNDWLIRNGFTKSINFKGTVHIVPQKRKKNRRPSP